MSKVLRHRKPRGSDWRRWDLHVHTPESILNNQFGADWDRYVYCLFRGAIDHGIAAIGITDYFSIEGYRKLTEEYLARPDRLRTIFARELTTDPDYITKLHDILIFPNIELRIDKFVTTKRNDGRSRLTMHVLFSNDVASQDIEANFLGRLTFPFRGAPGEPSETRTITRTSLMELGARLRGEHAQFQDRGDLFIGCMNATVNDDQLSSILANGGSLFRNKYILALAEEYASDIDWNGSDHQTRKVLYQKCDALFSSSEKTFAYVSSPDFAREFGREKACFWGCDAHALEDLFQSPHARYCWVKSDVSFAGLRQVLNEPASRCYLGEVPPSLRAIELHQKSYISDLRFAKKPESSLDERWFDGCHLHFNPGLVAIIGNKGSGKSALADTIALLGGSHVLREYFSFLRPERFRRKYQSARHDRAHDFDVSIGWSNGQSVTRSLAHEVSPDEVERVKYLPQGYLEHLCNENDDGARGVQGGTRPGHLLACARVRSAR